ncbi:Rv1678 family membrane protein [Lolliginicoccus suaedae]|uniref:Rv1678 family membrane protein n=1 Tax=Lolliginicoccus suaedae TaxID=2605429 RepID=UPI0016594FB6|nr:hypothetical protein [Lolliginicoccus suaedae]
MANNVIRWLLSPVRPDQRVGDGALTMLRIVAGLLWLYNVVWKQPPSFGENNNGGLYFFTSLGVEHPVFPPFSWIVENMVLPNFGIFGWVTLISETTLAVLLLTGTFVKLAALLGIGQSVAIGLSVAVAPHEWPWAYFMMIAIHLALLLAWSTRYLAVDAVRDAAATGDAAPRAASLMRTWGIVLAIVGVLAVALSFTEDLLASRGGLVGYQPLEVTLGNYNILGALVLLVIGLLLLGGAITRNAMIAAAAAALAVLAAASIYIQNGWSDVWLGGTNTSAALYLCAAVIAAASMHYLRQKPAPTRPGSGSGQGEP